MYVKEQFQSLKDFAIKTVISSTDVNSTTVLIPGNTYFISNVSGSAMFWINPTTIAMTTNKNGLTVPQQKSVFFIAVSTAMQTFTTVAGAPFTLGMLE